MSTGDRREARRKAAKAIAERACPRPEGWPVEDGPQPIPPDRVWYRDDLWEVDHVDVLGRWLLIAEGDEYHEERYADPADITFTVADARPEVACWKHSSWSQLLEREMKRAAEAMKADWERMMFGEDGKGLALLRNT